MYETGWNQVSNLLGEAGGGNSVLLGLPGDTAIGQDLEGCPRQRCHSVLLLILLPTHLTPHTSQQTSVFLLTHFYSSQ